MSKKRKTLQQHHKATGSEKSMLILSYAIMTICSLIAVLPCLHVISKSISSGNDVITGHVYFWPTALNVENYKFVLAKTSFFRAMLNSLLVTGLGTAISLFTTVTTAYPLSKKDLRGGKVFTMLYVISMIFYGGMIPAYMVVKTLGIIDTYAACILPFAIVQFNMFIVKNYFEGFPAAVEESARIDGAGDVKVLTAIICPMSKPVLATVTLLYAITYWNDYFHVMLYTTSASMNTLQVYLYNLISNSKSLIENMSSGSTVLNITSEGMTAAAITLSIIPIVLMYPFVSRYLVQGITIGSVKE